MSALTRLRPLRHFDLDLFRGDQVFAGHAKAPGSHLFDRAAILGGKPLRKLAALAGIGFAADLVHSERHAFMRFLRDGAV